MVLIVYIFLKIGEVTKDKTPITKSGNPGYIVGKPVVAGNLNNDINYPVDDTTRWVFTPNSKQKTWWLNMIYHGKSCHVFMTMDIHTLKSLKIIWKYIIINLT